MWLGVLFLVWFNNFDRTTGWLELNVLTLPTHSHGLIFSCIMPLWDGTHCAVGDIAKHLGLPSFREIWFIHWVVPVVPRAQLLGRDRSVPHAPTPGADGDTHSGERREIETPAAIARSATDYISSSNPPLYIAMFQDLFQVNIYSLSS